jgi:hypothetical protein
MAAGCQLFSDEGSQLAEAETMLLQKLDPKPSIPKPERNPAPDPHAKRERFALKAG